MCHSTQKKSFQRHSSEPISKSNTTKATNKSKKQRNTMTKANIKTPNVNKLYKHTKTKSKPKPSTCKFKTYLRAWAYHWAQLSHITQHWTALIIFPPNLQTSITAPILEESSNIAWKSIKIKNNLVLQHWMSAAMEWGYLQLTMYNGWTRQ